MHEYKAVIYREGFVGSLIFGASKISPEKPTNFLNAHAQQGWRVVTMEKDIQRILLFFKREAYVFLLER